MMDWRFCVICGDDGGDLRCPADSNQKNGLEVYTNFLQIVTEFQDFQLPAKVRFSENEDAVSFMENRAKWHKTCHLKFAPSKLLRLKHQIGEKRKTLEPGVT